MLLKVRYRLMKQKYFALKSRLGERVHDFLPKLKIGLGGFHKGIR